MSRSKIAATAANLSALIEDGFPAPAGLQAAIADAFADDHQFTGPLEEVRARLLLSTGGEAHNDAQSGALRELTSQVTPAQVWDLLTHLEREDTFAMSTRVWAAVRDGLLPHDHTLVALFSDSDGEELRMTALREAMRQAAMSGCTLLHKAVADGGLTQEEFAAESVHAACVPLTREVVFDAVAGMSVPVHKRLAMMFDESSWSGAVSPGPRFSSDLNLTVPDALLERALDVLHQALRPIGAPHTTPYTDEGIATISWLADIHHRQHGAISADQAERLRSRFPGKLLSVDLLTAWLGAAQPGYQVRLARDHVLPYLLSPFEKTDIDPWLDDLIDSGNLASRHIPIELLERRVIETGKLTTVPWNLRQHIVTTQLNFQRSWLTNPVKIADVNEVRSLVDAGRIKAHQVFHWYALAPAPVRAELLNAQGLAAHIAEQMGERNVNVKDRELLRPLLTSVVEMMPAGEELRTRLMMRVLTAKKDGSGPLDGDAQLRHGIEVLTTRWAEQDARTRTA